MFSLFIPPVATAMSVVSVPSVRLLELYISKAPPVAPTSVHEPTALHVVILVPYSSLYEKEGEVTDPSFETCMRKRTGVACATLETAVSAVPPVIEVAAASVPLSFLQ